MINAARSSDVTLVNRSVITRTHTRPTESAIKNRQSRAISGVATVFPHKMYIFGC
jgi:hypothetical protein